MPAYIAPPDRAYGHSFWLAFVANSLTMVAMGMLVRYADFVTYLGGAEGQLGLIVGAGMVGSLAMRFGQGVGIDRYGPRQIWLWSLFFFMVSLTAHWFVQSATGPAIFILRIVLQTSVAGIFGASITYISRTVPPARMAEIIGTLGTSGFVGLLIGPQLADAICAGNPITRGQLDRLFLVAAAMSGVALVAAWGATWGQSPPPVRRRPNPIALLRRYHPGLLLVVAMTVGACVTLPNTFLRPFAAELDIPRIGTFFSVYAVTAIVVRLLTRRMFARFENRVWVLLGLTSVAISFLLYLTVQTWWQLAIPGAMGGIAHGLLFPAVVATGSTSFPARHRGLGTTLVLGMIDLGSFIGTPLIGGMVSGSRAVGLPAYPLTLSVTAALALVIGTVYWMYGGAGRPSQRVRRRGSQRDHAIAAASRAPRPRKVRVPV